MHPQTGEKFHFDSWLVLCEYVLQLSEEIILEELSKKAPDLIASLADKIIASAQEYDPSKEEVG